MHNPPRSPQELARAVAENLTIGGAAVDAMLAQIRVLFEEAANYGREQERKRRELH